MTLPPPLRGEIWLVNLDPTLGREQAGTRPALVLSVDEFNGGPAELVVVLPVTSKDKKIPFHVGIKPPEGGVQVASYIKCEDIRSISKGRLHKRWGGVTPKTLEQVEDRLRILLSL
jgi:mRNA interferase MazF